jgi:hypothetical protein
MSTSDHGRATQVTSRKALTSRHLHACQSHMLLTMLVLACGGADPMACEGSSVLGMGLEQPQGAAGPSPARKRAHAAHGRMSKGPRCEASCAPASASAAERPAPARPTWSRPPFLSSLLRWATSFDPNLPLPGRRAPPQHRVHVEFTMLEVTRDLRASARVHYVSGAFRNFICQFRNTACMPTARPPHGP